MLLLKWLNISSVWNILSTNNQEKFFLTWKSNQKVVTTVHLHQLEKIWEHKKNKDRIAGIILIQRYAFFKSSRDLRFLILAFPDALVTLLRHKLWTYIFIPCIWTHMPIKSIFLKTIHHNLSTAKESWWHLKVLGIETKKKLYFHWF